MDEVLDRDPRRAEWLTPGVRGIGIASLLADLGHEVPTALLPSLLTSTLGAPASALGLIEGLADGLAGAARFAGGPLADDPQRRRSTAVAGYTTTAVLSGLVGVATSVWQVGVLRAGAWAARGLRVPSRNALLADVVPAESYGRAYGFERAMDNLGAIGGPLLALALVAAFSVRTAILLSIIPGLLAVAAIVYAIRSTPRPTSRRSARFASRFDLCCADGSDASSSASDSFEIANMAATLMILRATDVLAPDRGQDSAVKFAISLYVLYNVAATLVSIPGGLHGDRRGMVRVFAYGVGCFAAAYALLALAGGIWVLAAGFVVAGVGIGLVETAEHAAVATFAPDSIRGSAFGLLAAVQSFGNLAASAVAASSTRLASPAAAFWYASAIMLGALLVVATTYARDRAA